MDIIHGRQNHSQILISCFSYVQKFIYFFFVIVFRRPAVDNAVAAARDPAGHQVLYL